MPASLRTLAHITCRAHSGAKRPREDEGAGADPDAAVAAPGDEHAMRERLLAMESQFREQRAADKAAAAAAAAPSKERGAGDWANYQPPSEVLKAVQQRQAEQAAAAAAQQQQQHQQHVAAAAAAAPAAQAPPAAAQPAGSGLPLKRDLPPALRARLAARGILPKEDAAGGGGSSGEGETVVGLLGSSRVAGMQPWSPSSLAACACMPASRPLACPSCRPPSLPPSPASLQARCPQAGTRPATQLTTGSTFTTPLPGTGRGRGPPHPS